MSLRATGFDSTQDTKTTCVSFPPAMVRPMTVEAAPLLETLSPSRAGDFKTCPQLFKFRAIDRLPEPVTPHQARGTTAHLALQPLFDLPSHQRTPERLFDLFREAWTASRTRAGHRPPFPTRGEGGSVGTAALPLLANYFGREATPRHEPRDRELDVCEDRDGLVIRGILARTARDDEGRVVITDYKTGKAPPE